MKKLGIVLLVLFFAILPFANRTPQDHLLITEVSVNGSSGYNGEYIEIYNPSDYAIDLSHVYLTDATYASGGVYYYKIVTGNGGGGSHNDFNAKFPDGAKIDPGQYIVVAMNGTDFVSKFGIKPDYELYDTDSSIPDMVEATTGSINGQGTLTSSGEVVIMYYWDGHSDLVKDLDYFMWGDQAEAVCKTGVAIDGPDADSTPSTYADDIATNSQAYQIGISGDNRFFTFQRVDMSEGTELKNVGGNGIFGDNETSEDIDKTFVLALPTPGKPYDSALYSGTNYIGYAEDDSWAEIGGVDFSLYPAGTSIDDILFLGATPVATATSTPNGVNRRINLDFQGLTEGASYVITGFGNGYAYKNITKDVYTGTFDYITVYDEVKDNTQKVQVCSKGGTISALITWAAYTDSASGDAADSYEIHVYNGTTVDTYTTTGTTQNIDMSEGETYKYVIFAKLSGNYISRSAVGEIKATNFIDKVELVDTNNIKVHFTEALNNVGTVDVDGMSPVGTNFTAGNDWAEFEFANAFTFGNTYTLNMVNFVTSSDTSTMYSESAVFTAESNFGIVSGKVENATCIALVFSDSVDPTTGGNVANYSISPAVTITSVNVMDTTVQLMLASSISYNTDYTVTVSGVNSKKGLPINSNNSVTVNKSGTAIQLSSANVMTAKMVELAFTGNVYSGTNTGAFTVSGLTVSSVAVNGSNVDVYFTSNIVKGTNYTITANVKDTNGFDIDSAHNSTTFTLNAVYPEITKAEMIDRQTVKIYFSKDMSQDTRAFGYVQDPWLYSVIDSEASPSMLILTNFVKYNADDNTAEIHLESAMPANSTLILDASGLFYYYGYAWPTPAGTHYYPTDTDGYTVYQSGKYYASFKTTVSDLTQVYTYPSPATGTTVTFTNLAGSGTISIYTLNGVKIDDVDFNNEVEKTVELTTPSGKPYVNGVYLYKIKSDKGTVTGSFAVLK